MASRYQIQMDFDRAKQQASKLDDIANSLSNLSNKDLENTLNSLGNDWKGDNATSYINKGNQLQVNMNKTVNGLQSTADTIRQIAQNIYNAEMEALRIAEEREAAARRAAEAAAAAAAAAASAGGSGRGGGGGGGGHGRGR